MAKINTYPTVTPALNDKVVGTDVSEQGTDPNGKSVNFLISAILTLIEDNITLGMTARSSDLDDPAANASVLWQSDGTGAGDDGDIMIKITDSGGTTKTITLVDFSAF